MLLSFAFSTLTHCLILPLSCFGYTYMLAVQASYVIDERVDHALSKFKEKESCRLTATKA